jgi:ribonuclease T
MAGHADEVYISVDVETAGPIPSEYSMLAIGAVIVGDPERSFYAELKPMTSRFIPAALRVSRLSLDTLQRDGRDPAEVMRAFRDWIRATAADRRPIFVGFNAAFDWSFVNWYFHYYLSENPFGIGGIDIKAYYMGLAGGRWSETTYSHLPARFRASVPQTHNALDDARVQAEVFAKLLLARRAE